MSNVKTRIATGIATLATVATLGAAGAAPQAAATSAAPPSAQDIAYLHFAAHSNLTEIAQGKLAKRHASKPAVRQFARHLVRDHRQQYRALETLATSLGVTLPTHPSVEQRRIIKAWRTLDGQALTCAYVPFQWGSHQLTIAMTVRETERGTEPAVVQAATASLPVLEEHLTHATQLVRRLKHC